MRSHYRRDAFVAEPAGTDPDVLNGATVKHPAGVHSPAKVAGVPSGAYRSSPGPTNPRSDRIAVDVRQARDEALATEEHQRSSPRCLGFGVSAIAV
jgi:hypothetical protein